MTIDMTQVVTQVLIAAIGFVFTVLIAPPLKALFTWLKEKAALVKEQTLATALTTALDEAEVVAANVVAGLNATLVRELRERSADGHLSDEDIAQVVEASFNAFKSDLSAKSFQLLLNNTDSITDAVRRLIERKLAELQE